MCCCPDRGSRGGGAFCQNVVECFGPHALLSLLRSLPPGRHWKHHRPLGQLVCSCYVEEKCTTLFVAWRMSSGGAHPRSGLEGVINKHQYPCQHQRYGIKTSKLQLVYDYSNRREFDLSSRPPSHYLTYVYEILHPYTSAATAPDVLCP